MSPIRAAAPCSVRWRGRGTGPARRRYLLSPCVVAGENPLTQGFPAATVHHVEQPRHPRPVRSTTPVTKLVEWEALAARNAVSSTPRRRTPSTRCGSSTSGRPCSRTAFMIACQPAPYWPATRATVLPSCPTRRQASRRAPLGQRRPRPDVLTGLRPVRRGQSGSMHRHARLIHTRITGRPPAGRSRTSVRRRSSNRALVSMAYSISLSCSDTVSSTNPERRASPSPQSVVVHLGPPSTRVQAPRI